MAVHRKERRPVRAVARIGARPGLLFAIALLASCGGGDETSAPADTSRTLRFATVAELPDLLLAPEATAVQWTGPDTITNLGAPGATQPASGTGTGTGFSRPNRFETGVSESDILASDGRYVYTLSKAEPAETGPFPSLDVPEAHGGAMLRILEIGADPTVLTGISRMAITGQDDTPPHPEGLYLTDDHAQLVVVGSRGEDPWLNWHTSGSPGSSETTVQVLDVSRPGSPQVTRTMRFTGGLVDSRMVGDFLYLITRYTPAGASTGTPDVPPGHLLPGIGIDGGPLRNMDLTGCFVENTDTPRASRMISLTAIDLSAPDPDYQSICYAGEAITVYASSRAMYLASSDWRHGAALAEGDEAAAFRAHTLVHKFAFDRTRITYRGSGVAAGELADTPREAAWRLSEQGNDLRIVTQAFERPAFIEPVGIDGGATTAPREAGVSSPVVLTVLRDNGAGDLEKVAMLPNRQRPESIGLDGERLYGTRFVGDFAYVVTFRVVDPPM